MRRFPRNNRALLPALLAGALMFGCDDGDDDDDGPRDSGTMDASAMDASTDASTDAATDSSAPDAGNLSDNQIVQVIALVNMGEIAAANLALNKPAMNAQVRAYATDMVAMHTAAETRRNALGITPATSDLAETLMAAASAVSQQLMNTPAGPAFDLLYIQSQVDMHQMALNTATSVLLPSASSQALKTELTNLQAAIMAHLTQAQQIRAALSDAGVGDGGASDAGTTDAATADASMDDGGG